MQLKFINLNDLYDPKYLITNPDGIDSKKGKKAKDENSNKKQKKFTSDGIFSEEIFGKMDSDTIKYSCQCGKYRGHFYLGKMCDECNTKVTNVDSDINTIGWIDLGNHNIINPIFYNFLTKLGNRNFKEIITYDKKLNKDGLIIEEEESNNPYYNIGIKEFQKNFDEILEWLKDHANDNKYKFYEIIKENKDLVFINKIPIFSPVLRPALMMKNSLIFDKINNLYNKIIKNSNMLKANTENEDTDLNVMPLLINTQDTFNEVFVKIINALKGKKGFIRNNLMGNRINWSSRCVIIPLEDGFDIDSIELPYIVVMELYKFQLINLISKIKKVTFNEANNIWSKALVKCDKSMIKIINEFIAKGNPQVLLNRNPTINYGSTIKLKLVGIKKDYDNLTASIHNCILPPLAADYDGDTLNIIPLMDEAWKTMFEIYSPKRMLINADNGHFNSAISLDKDQILGMFTFNR